MDFRKVHPRTVEKSVEIDARFKKPKAHTPTHVRKISTPWYSEDTCYDYRNVYEEDELKKMGKHKLAVVIMNATLSGNYNVQSSKEGQDPTEFDLLNKL